MRRIYHHYERWEDYQAGLYAIPHARPDDAEKIAAAAALLSDPRRLEAAMRMVAFDWPHAAEVNLTNPSRNREAWEADTANQVNEIDDLSIEGEGGDEEPEPS